MCHTDLHYREGGINDEFPFLLGHEAAGIVEAVGEGVTDVAPGDFVILNWRAVCGNCRACRRGEPWYCFATHNAAQKMTLTSGQELSPALGIGAFVEKTLVHAGQCTKVNPAAKPEVAGLLGCGVMAGIGAAINTGKVGRGDSIAVIGCGGVGNAAIAGARLAGASTIIAVDIDDTKLEWAEEFGATHTVNSRQTDPVEKVRELTGGFGTDVVVEAVGRPQTYQQAFFMRDLAGTVVLVGVPTPRHDDRAAADRGVRPRRGAEVVVVRRLPAVPRLPHADRPAPAGPAAAGEVRQREDRPRRRRGGVPPHGARRGPALGGDVVSVPIQRVVTSGTFSLDGGTWDVDNNVWIVGDENEVIVVDAAHDLEKIAQEIGGRRVVAVVCTHAHDDHVNQAPALSDRFGAPVLLNPAEAPLWQMTHPDRKPDGELADGDVLRAGGIELRVLLTPGHSPGSSCLHSPELGTVFTGDTLFQGGPGATGRSYSSFDTIVESIRTTLLTLPGDTTVRTGHGDSTSIGAEAPHLEEWLARGH